MADESRASIASKRSSLWSKEITSNGLAGLLSFETPRTAIRRRRDVYKRLRKDEFRLLQIDYSHKTTAISGTFSCRLETHKLGTFQNEYGYGAVSYTWMSHAQRWNYGEDQASVKIQDQTLPAASKIAPMLATLYKNGFKRVWIDALCINQLDVSERSNQVALMRQIYSSASRVVVFLGSGSPDTDAFFNFLNQGIAQGRRMSDEELSGLSEVVSNPYWQRAWIIQEVAVARKVELICGSKRSSWDALVHALSRWDVSEWASPISSGSDSPGREIRTIDNFRTERHGSLIEVLQKTRSSKASNPLDVVYAKLGLANDASSLVPRISYATAASTLFKSIVKRYVMAKNDLYIICLVRESQTDEIHLPSWTPDWTKSTNRYPLLRFFFSGWLNVTHSTHARMDVSFSSDLNELRVRGLRLDRLGHGSAFMQPGDASDGSARNMFPRICRAALAAHFVLPTHNDWSTMPVEFIDLFARRALCYEADERLAPNGTVHTVSYARSNAGDTTISGEHSWDVEDRPAAPRFDDFRRWYEINHRVVLAGQTVEHWTKAYHATLTLVDEQTNGTANLRTGGVEKSLTAMAWNRRLLGTISGRPALVPEAATDGDFVCALYGCPVPVVLRSVKQHYLFIGECFVEDFMDETQNYANQLRLPKETMFNLR